MSVEILWKVAVTSAAAFYVVYAVFNETPYFVALPASLLFMSILASDERKP